MMPKFLYGTITAWAPPDAMSFVHVEGFRLSMGRCSPAKFATEAGGKEMT